MKKIKIYLIAKENSLKEDKIELSNFIRDLNEKYETKNIYFKLFVNDEIKEEDIKDSELFFVLFSTDIDNDSIQKFNIAYSNFKESKNPKIIAYSKKRTEVSTSVLNFMKKLGEELGHYYSEYEHIDTIKLNLMEQLENLGFKEIKLEIKEDKLYLNGEKWLTLDNLPIFKNNQILEKLCKESNEIEETFWKLKEQVRENPDDDKLFDEYTDLCVRRKKVKEDITTLEMDILSLERSFVKMSGEGPLSKRQIYARKCLEEGNLETAKEALDFEEITEEANQILKIQNMKKEELQIKVNELKQRIGILKLDIQNKNRFEEIEKTYEEAIRIEKEGGLYRKTMIDYCGYLNVQNKFRKVIEVGKKFLAYIESNDMKNQLEDISDTYNWIGISYYRLKDLKQAQKYQCNSIKTKEKLLKIDYKKYKDVLALSYNNLALLYADNQNYKEAEEYYKKAIKIREEPEILDGKVITVYDSDTPIFYSNLAHLYVQIGQYQEAEEYYKKAIEIEERVVETLNDDTSKNSLSISYNNLAMLYEKIGHYEEALKYCNKSFPILVEIEKNNPEAYEDSMASIYHNLGLIYNDMGQHTDSEIYYKKAIEIKERLAKLEFIIYGNSLAKSYHNLSNLYNYIGRNEEAIEYYRKVINIYEKLIQINPDIYEEKLVHSYTIMGVLYGLVANYEKTEIYYKKAIELGEKLVLKNEKYKFEMMDIYHNIIVLYTVQLEKNEEVEKYYEKLIKIEEEYSEIYPNECNDELFSSYHLFAQFYQNKNNYEKAIEYYDKVLKILNRIIDNEEMRNEVMYRTLDNVALLYHKLALSNRKEKKYEEAKSNCVKSIDIWKSLEKNNVEINKVVFAQVYTNLAKILTELKEFEKGVECYKKAIEIRKGIIKNEENISEKYNLSSTYNYLAYLYDDMKLYNEAEKYYVKGIELCEDITNENPIYYNHLATLHNNLGYLYNEIKRYKEAEVNYQKAINIWKELFKNNENYKERLVNIYNKMIILYTNMNLINKIEEYEEKIIELEKDTVNNF